MIEPTDAALNFALRRSIAENEKRRREDEAHELRIAEALAQWHAARVPSEARKAYALFCKLVEMRSPRMVRKLELEKGLVT